MSKKITRRQFLTYTAAGIGVTALACGGLGTLAFHNPVDATFQKFSANSDPLNPYALVTYATRAGSTMEIARVIGMELENRGFSVDVCPIRQVKSIEGYNHIVIGSAVRMGTTLPEVSDFIIENQNSLEKIPLAFFAVHLQYDGEDEASQKARRAYLDAIRNQIRLQHEAFFTGVYDPTKVSFVDGLIGKMVKTPVGDFRDWPAIKDWGQSIFITSPISRIEDCYSMMT
jgi:menaquinone-dependent protoporphyrinogen oxidase